MATLAEINNLAVGNPELRQRFMAARLKASWDITNESGSTQYHTERMAWAGKILGGYYADADKEYLRFLSNTTIQSGGNSSTDNDIQFVVNSLINTYAGV
jgi:hypothetical protein